MGSWRYPEADASGHRVPGVERLQLAAEEVGREAKVAGVFVEDRHKVIGDHVLVRVQKVGRAVGDFAREVLNAKRPRVEASGVQESWVLLVLDLDLGDVTLGCASNGAFDVEHAQESGSLEWKWLEGVFSPIIEITRLTREEMRSMQGTLST